MIALSCNGLNVRRLEAVKKVVSNMLARSTLHTRKIWRNYSLGSFFLSIFFSWRNVNKAWLFLNLGKTGKLREGGLPHQDHFFPLFKLLWTFCLLPNLSLFAFYAHDVLYKTWWKFKLPRALWILFWLSLILLCHCFFKFLILNLILWFFNNIFAYYSRLLCEGGTLF